MKLQNIILSYALVIFSCGYIAKDIITIEHSYTITGAASALESQMVLPIANYQKKLTKGEITGAAVPISPSIVTSEGINDIFKNPWLNQHLIKAMQANSLSSVNAQKAVLIKDSEIKPYSYKVTYFKLPQNINENIAVKITQSSETAQGIETRLFINMKPSEIEETFKDSTLEAFFIKDKEIRLNTKEHLHDEGLFQKTGNITLTDQEENTAAIVTIYTPSKEAQPINYAYVVTFKES